MLCIKVILNRGFIITMEIFLMMKAGKLIRQGLEESITAGQQPAGSVQKTVQIIRVPVSGVDRTGNESAKKRCA